jgi:hypothetical protein
MLQLHAPGETDGAAKEGWMLLCNKRAKKAPQNLTPAFSQRYDNNNLIISETFIVPSLL